uniref:Uncharacterized protein n=1 Tax=Anguilla anguilla TaxID=7936 RepID=A0A0E9SZC0_ANGAN
MQDTEDRPVFGGIVTEDTVRHKFPHLVHTLNLSSHNVHILSQNS